MFELLACDKLTSDRHLWVLVFIPLIFGRWSVSCVWAVKHDRSFELEPYLAVNALQFVSLPLKLDPFVYWHLDVVFVPYNFIFCGIIMRTPEVSLQQKKAALNAASQVDATSSSKRTGGGSGIEQLYKFGKHKKSKKAAKIDTLKPVVPFVSIDLPD
ncbi:transmembrane protein 185B-like [Drosophila bipectinata]|uniref:transmembrane protein 185B-like n=1 Tax=Drosophila bipectinata TaxID=42026 RepID=UPI0038B2B4E6